MARSQLQFYGRKKTLARSVSEEATLARSVSEETTLARSVSEEAVDTRDRLGLIWVVDWCFETIPSSKHKCGQRRQA
jgi:hypothetical protein